MHSTSFNAEVNSSQGGEVLVSVATLVTEGRLPGSSCSTSGSKKFYEGPHCKLVKGADKGHICDLVDSLCLKFENDRTQVLNLCQKDIPLCIEVILTCPCKELDIVADPLEENIYVLEQWHLSINSKRNTNPLPFNLNQLVSAIRSQLYFSQITAWLMTQDEGSPSKITEANFRYHLTVPGKSFTTSKFHLSAVKHEFPTTQIGNGLYLSVSFFSLPRSPTIPVIACQDCSKGKHMTQGTTKVPVNNQMDLKNGVVDDRMHLSCTLKGKHRCEEFEEDENIKIESKLIKRICNKSLCEASTSRSKPKLKIYIHDSSLLPSYNGCEKRNISPNIEQKVKSAKFDVDYGIDDLSKDKGQLLLEAIERSGQKSTNERKKCESDTAICDKKSESDIISIREKNNFNIYVDKHCDSPIPILRQKQIRDISNLDVSRLKRSNAKQKISFDDSESTTSCDKTTTGCDQKSKDDKDVGVPSATEQAKFRKNLGNAASMVFHSRTGLPLTSSPAPVRRGKSCFDFDSTINSVSAIKSALFSNSFSTDDESESEGSSPSPCSPESLVVRDDDKKDVSSPLKKYRRKGHAANLLGSFEESVLNGRLEPVSTVHGFTAELGASGSFVPKHLVVPVTVFFYTLGDNDKVSSPYLSHINLGKKGYNVPKSGTVQVTLFNPLGTVVKMFVIMYDLTDMPPNSQTFIRQRTLYMPTNCKDANLEWGPKWLRYLIHLRFMSSKSGKIYLHSDIRMIIFRKCDMDTATAHGIDMSYELRSFTHMPANPRFSPRK